MYFQQCGKLLYYGIAGKGCLDNAFLLEMITWHLPELIAMLEQKYFYPDAKFGYSNLHCSLQKHPMSKDTKALCTLVPTANGKDKFITDKEEYWDSKHQQTFTKML